MCAYFAAVIEILDATTQVWPPLRMRNVRTGVSLRSEQLQATVAANASFSQIQIN